jgi:hypothetical protein
LPNTDQEPEARASIDPKVDAVWEKKYGPIKTTTRYFAIMPDYSARWFNERNSLDEIRPKERNGLALSPNGAERTASTNYHTTADGERYTDHSIHGKRSDGTKDSGDALELAAKVQGVSKSSLLSQINKDIQSKALAAIECAAAAGLPVPSWLEEPCIITRAGRKRHAYLLKQAAFQLDAVIERTRTEQPAEQIETPQASTQDGQQAEEKRVEYEDGIAYYIGWTDEEYHQHLHEDAQARHRARLWEEARPGIGAKKLIASSSAPMAQQVTLL